MSDWTTLSVRKETAERFNDAKDENESADLFINELLTGYDPDSTESVDTEAIAEELKNEISMANEPGVAVDIRGLINRIDDLEAHIDGRFDEVQR